FDFERPRERFGTLCKEESHSELILIGFPGVRFPSATFAAFSGLNASDSHWNLDMKELEYSPSAKDTDDKRINHLLDVSMFKPYRRYGRAPRYRRQAVCDRDLGQTSHNRTYVNMRRYISDHASRHAACHKKALKAGNKANGNVPNGKNLKNVSFAVDRIDESAQKSTPQKNERKGTPTHSVEVNEESDRMPNDDEGIIFFTASGRSS
ncbi:unnamed protein product, partial [Darwinula stevensoni]